MPRVVRDRDVVYKRTTFEPALQVPASFCKRKCKKGRNATEHFATLRESDVSDALVAYASVIISVCVCDAKDEIVKTRHVTAQRQRGAQAGVTCQLLTNVYLAHSRVTVEPVTGIRGIRNPHLFVWLVVCYSRYLNVTSVATVRPAMLVGGRVADNHAVGALPSHRTKRSVERVVAHNGAL